MFKGGGMVCFKVVDAKASELDSGVRYPDMHIGPTEYQQEA